MESMQPIQTFGVKQEFVIPLPGNGDWEFKWGGWKEKANTIDCFGTWTAKQGDVSHESMAIVYGYDAVVNEGAGKSLCEERKQSALVALIRLIDKDVDIDRVLELEVLTVS